MKKRVGKEKEKKDFIQRFFWYPFMIIFFGLVVFFSIIIIRYQSLWISFLTLSFLSIIFSIMGIIKMKNKLVPIIILIITIILVLVESTIFRAPL